MEDRMEKLETRMDRMEERQQRIETEQAETRVYVKQIFERLDGLKDDLFTLFGKKSDTSKDTKQWIDFSKWIIAGTIFVIVAYIFTQK